MASQQSSDRLLKILGDLARELVDHSDDVEVSSTISDGGSTVILTLRTAVGEVGKVIGKKGRNAQALRVLLEAVAAKHKQRVVLEIADDNKRHGHGQSSRDVGRR